MTDLHELLLLFVLAVALFNAVTVFRLRKCVLALEASIATVTQALIATTRKEAFAEGAMQANQRSLLKTEAETRGFLRGSQVPINDQAKETAADIKDTARNTKDIAENTAGTRAERNKA